MFFVRCCFARDREEERKASLLPQADSNEPLDQENASTTKKKKKHSKLKQHNVYSSYGTDRSTSDLIIHVPASPRAEKGHCPAVLLLTPDDNSVEGLVGSSQEALSGSSSGNALGICDSDDTLLNVRGCESLIPSDSKYNIRRFSQQDDDIKLALSGGGLVRGEFTCDEVSTVNNVPPALDLASVEVDLHQFNDVTSGLCNSCRSIDSLTADDGDSGLDSNIGLTESLEIHLDSSAECNVTYINPTAGPGVSDLEHQFNKPKNYKLSIDYSSLAESQHVEKNSNDTSSEDLIESVSRDFASKIIETVSQIFHAKPIELNKKYKSDYDAAKSTDFISREGQVENVCEITDDRQDPMHEDKRSFAAEDYYLADKKTELTKMEQMKFESSTDDPISLTEAEHSLDEDEWNQNTINESLTFPEDQSETNTSPVMLSLTEACHGNDHCFPSDILKIEKETGPVNPTRSLMSTCRHVDEDMSFHDLVQKKQEEYQPEEIHTTPIWHGFKELETTSTIPMYAEFPEQKVNGLDKSKPEEFDEPLSINTVIPQSYGIDEKLLTGNDLATDISDQDIILREEPSCPPDEPESDENLSQTEVQLRTEAAFGQEFVAEILKQSAVRFKQMCEMENETCTFSHMTRFERTVDLNDVTDVLVSDTSDELKPGEFEGNCNFKDFKQTENEFSLHSEDFFARIHINDADDSLRLQNEDELMCAINELCVEPLCGTVKDTSREASCLLEIETFSEPGASLCSSMAEVEEDDRIHDATDENVVYTEPAKINYAANEQMHASYGADGSIEEMVHKIDLCSNADLTLAETCCQLDEENYNSTSCEEPNYEELCIVVQPLSLIESSLDSLSNSIQFDNDCLPRSEAVIIQFSSEFTTNVLDRALNEVNFCGRQLDAEEETHCLCEFVQDKIQNTDSEDIDFCTVDEMFEEYCSQFAIDVIRHSLKKLETVEKTETKPHLDLFTFSDYGSEALSGEDNILSQCSDVQNNTIINTLYGGFSGYSLSIDAQPSCCSDHCDCTYATDYFNPQIATGAENDVNFKQNHFPDTPDDDVSSSELRLSENTSLFVLEHNQCSSDKQSLTVSELINNIVHASAVEVLGIGGRSSHLETPDRTSTDVTQSMLSLNTAAGCGDDVQASSCNTVQQLQRQDETTTSLTDKVSTELSNKADVFSSISNCDVSFNPTKVNKRFVVTKYKQPTVKKLSQHGQYSAARDDNETSAVQCDETAQLLTSGQQTEIGIFDKNFQNPRPIKKYSPVHNQSYNSETDISQQFFSTYVLDLSKDNETSASATQECSLNSLNTLKIEQLLNQDKNDDEESDDMIIYNITEQRDESFAVQYEGTDHSRPVRRSTSLKTSPVDSIRAKKVVRFADALGLDLTSIRTIKSLEDAPTFTQIPYIFQSQPEDVIISAEILPVTAENQGYSLGFIQPCSMTNFDARVRDLRVSLESCDLNNAEMMVTGTVRVLNVAYRKHVFIRHTSNYWVTHSDTAGSYMDHSINGASDRFGFSLFLPRSVESDSWIEFAVCFLAGENLELSFWDNNDGANYIVHCIHGSNRSEDSSWLSFL